MFCGGIQWLDRFEDALAAVQRASRLDSNNREASMVMRKARAISSARSKGNELFKAGRFSEACIAYGEGLEHDPHNSVLLCNRAACRCKLGQLEKAIDDCTVALNVRPSYSKARLRRADCNSKVAVLHLIMLVISFHCLIMSMFLNVYICFTYSWNVGKLPYKTTRFWYKKHRKTKK